MTPTQILAEINVSEVAKALAVLLKALYALLRAAGALLMKVDSAFIGRNALYAKVRKPVDTYSKFALVAELYAEQTPEVRAEYPSYQRIVYELYAALTAK